MFIYYFNFNLCTLKTCFRFVALAWFINVCRWPNLGMPDFPIWITFISLQQGSMEMEFFSDYGDANRYKIQEVIGKGSYGVVCSAIDTHTGEKVAIKKIHDIFEHVSDTARILREIKLLRLLRHPDIVEIKHVMLPPSRRDFKDIYVVFELMESDLHQVIKANDDLTKEHYQFFLYQLLRALKYIHTGILQYLLVTSSSISYLNAHCVANNSYIYLVFSTWMKCNWNCIIPLHFSLQRCQHYVYQFFFVYCCWLFVFTTWLDFLKLIRFDQNVLLIHFPFLYFTLCINQLKFADFNARIIAHLIFVNKHCSKCLSSRLEAKEYISQCKL